MDAKLKGSLIQPIDFFFFFLQYAFLSIVFYLVCFQHQLAKLNILFKLFYLQIKPCVN